MSYSACDFMDDIMGALEIDTDSSDVEEQAELTIAEICRLQRIERAWKAGRRFTGVHTDQGGDDANES